MIRQRKFAGMLCAVVCLLSLRTFAQEPVFTGAFADGAYATGAKLIDWQNTASQPRLNDRPLFSGATVRWLQNQSLEAIAQPNAYIEMVGGDRFPGQVIEYSDGTGVYDERQPPHLIVKPETGIDYPDQFARPTVHISAGSLRRVVWQRRSADRYQPGTLFYADGRQVTFRTLRWSAEAVMLLLEDGSRKVPFTEIAEVHLPRRDSWEAYYEALAVLTPECTSRLMRVETFGGLQATVSLDRFQARAVSGDPAGWYHMLQPAWSLDPLWIRHSTIAWRRFFQPQQMPLSLIEPARSVQRASFSAGLPWQVDRSVTGSPLHSAGKTYGWGLGVHAYSELEFSIHPAANSFRTLVGLDDAAGRGGCAVARAYFARVDGQPAFQTKTLVGSQEIQDSGALAIKHDAGAAKLILVADPNPADRPAGADPLDIRDMVNWLEPQFELDLEKLKTEVRKRLPQAIPAWNGWASELEPGAKLQLAHRWDTTDGRNQRYRSETFAAPGILKLRRRIKVGPQQNYLALSLARYPEGTQPSKVEVLIDGQLIAETEVRERRTDGRFEAQAVSLKPYQGREVDIAVVHKPTSDKSVVQWRSLEIVEHLTATPWSPLTPLELKASSADIVLKTLDDQSVLAAGKAPEACSYTITSKTMLQGITALQLEALTDPSLPNQGPGLAGNGNFVLSDVRVTAAPAGNLMAAVPVEFQEATADFSQQEYPVASAIDDNPQTGWGTMSQPAQAHIAVFTTKQNIGFAEGTVLTVTLDHRATSQHALGRFRLAVTDAQRPVAVERPAVVLPPAKGKTVALPNGPVQVARQ